MYVCRYITLTWYGVAAIRFFTIMDLNCGAMENPSDSLHIQKIGPQVLLYVYLNGCMYICMYVFMYVCMYVYLNVMAEQNTYV